MGRERCSKLVWTREYGRFSPCSRYAVKDGYCKQHHPDAVKARTKAAEERIKQKEARSPSNRLIVLSARVAELETENKRIMEALDKDSSGMAAALGKIRAEVKARRWIVEGRGSYEWDDEQYRRETGLALDAIETIADSALSASGKLVFESLKDTQTYDDLRAALEVQP